MHTLLSEFLAEDCDSTVRGQLLAALDQHKTSQGSVLREFNFNRFNIHFDLTQNLVTVDDELDTGESGSCTISLTAFVAALQAHTPRR